MSYASFRSGRDGALTRRWLWEPTVVPRLQSGSVSGPASSGNERKPSGALSGAPRRKHNPLVTAASTPTSPGSSPGRSRATPTSTERVGENGVERLRGSWPLLELTSDKLIDGLAIGRGGLHELNAHVGGARRLALGGLADVDDPPFRP
jgi:hypothetical protein